MKMMLQHVFFLFLFALKEENNNTISKENIFFCTRNIIIIIYIIQFYNYLENIRHHLNLFKIQNTIPPKKKKTRC